MILHIKSTTGQHFLVLIVLFIISSEIFAQEGQWMEYTLDGFGSGTPVYDCGDGCCGYALENSGSVLCFDVNKNDWMKIDLGESQIFQHMKSSGNILFSLTDQLVFAYSSSTGEWDTVYYEGTELPGSGWSSPCYGCSDSLAFFLTTENFYVFDGGDGEWKKYSYTFPGNFANARYLINDNYIAAIISRTNYEEGYLNLSYSAFTGTFVELDPGANIIPVNYDDGYAGLFDKTGTGKEFLIVGYNAQKNQYTLLDYTAEDETAVIFSGSKLLPADPFHAYCIGFRKVVTPSELLQIKYYGYSTALGEWNMVSYDIDLTNESYSGNGVIGGIFTSDYSIAGDANMKRFFFFTSGDTSFHEVQSEIKSSSSGTHSGGKVFVAFDNQKGWGYNPTTRNGKEISFSHEKTTNQHISDDFITLSRYSYDSNSMNTYFYNSRTSRWSSVELPKNTGLTGYLTSSTYLYNNWPENLAIFYSANEDSILKIDLSDNLNYYGEANEHLAYLRSEGHSVIFNADHCTIHEKDFQFNQNGLGSGSGAFFNPADSSLHGYSSVSDSWATKKIGEEPYYSVNEGYIGLVSSWLNNNSFGKFYAYNAFSDSWIELVPEGLYQGVELGHRTAMVMHSEHVYAFHPFRDPDVSSGPSLEVNPGFKLSRNYPNPFVDFTHIEYETASESKVILKVYNSMGQEVKTLVNENQPGGRYAVSWNGKDKQGQSSGPGIYIYRLRAGNKVISKRMTLLSK